MKELDFDELDRAVNSLATQASNRLDDKVNGTSSAHVSDDSSLAPKEAHVTSLPPVKDTSQPVDEPSESPTTAPLAASTPITPERRAARFMVKRPASSGASRGGFMDIVAPPKTANHPKASRIGPTIQPMDKKEEPDTEPAKPDLKMAHTTEHHASKITTVPAEDMPRPGHTSQPTAEPFMPEVAPKKEAVKWPDPLDFTPEPQPYAPSSVPKFAQASADLKDELMQPSETAETSRWQSKSEPTPSPFIPGAKVEKRPLGAFALAPSPADVPAQSDDEAAAALEPAKTNERLPEIPEELKPDVLAVESDEVSQEPDEVPAAPAPLESSAKSDEEPLPAFPKSETAAQQVQDSAAMSIPKQYAIADKPIDDTPRPVFDTKEYHPPLLEATVHGSHQGSLWNRLFIALLVVALLAVGGYFVFVYFVQAY